MMKRLAFCLVVMAWLLIFIDPALARKWTDSSGKFSIEAELVEVKDGDVRLKRTDGKVISIAVSKLSKADRVRPSR